MPRLAALLLRGGPRFVDEVRRVWDRGDALLPLDPRAPEVFVRRQLEELAPASVIDESGETARRGGRPVEHGDALVIATSGTTGRPRGVVLTRDAIEAHAYASATALGVAPDVGWLACLPLHHMGGFGVVARALVTGAGLEVHDGFDADAVRTAAGRGATHTSLVPTALARIDPAWFRVVLVGGAAAPGKRPRNCVATYGLTESCGGVVYDGLPLNGVGLRVTQDHHVELSGPTIARGYRDGPLHLTADGWLRTGDLGEVDAETGALTVWGRAAEVIVTGGVKVWPAAVERVLSGDPSVQVVRVEGRPDPEWGERVVAVVVPSDPAEPPSLEQLRERVKAELPTSHAPKELELRDSLPTTSLGKPVRHRGP